MSFLGGFPRFSLAKGRPVVKAWHTRTSCIGTLRDSNRTMSRFLGGQAQVCCNCPMAHTSLLILTMVAALSAGVQERPTDDDALLRGIERLRGTLEDSPDEIVANRPAEPIRKVEPMYTIPPGPREL